MANVSNYQHIALEQIEEEWTLPNTLGSNRPSDPRDPEVSENLAWLELAFLNMTFKNKHLQSTILVHTALKLHS